MSAILGEIRRDAIYPKADFQQRTGLKDAAWREAKKNGLRTIMAHRRVYVRGADFHAYLDKLAAETETVAG